MTIWKLLQSTPVGFSVTVPLPQQKSAFSISAYRVLSSKRTLLWGTFSQLWLSSPSLLCLWGRSWECHCDGTFLRDWDSRKSQTSIIYVQMLGNLSNCSEKQSVIRNMSGSNPSCVSPGWLRLFSLKCLCWRALNGKGAEPKLSLLHHCSANTVCADQAQLISLYGSESVCCGTAVVAGGQSYPAAAWGSLSSGLQGVAGWMYFHTDMYFLWLYTYTGVGFLVA